MKCGFVAKSWKSGMTGMAGNMRVASELLLRGLNVSIPLVDTGVDLEVEGVVKLQVKSAHVMKRPSENCPPGYNFCLGRGPKALGGGKATISTPRIFSEKVHFVVLWGIEQSRFWIVPAEKLDGRMTIYLGPEGRWIATDAEKIKQMLESGMTQRDISLALGVSEMTISRRVNKIFTSPSETIADLISIRECEGRWDHIHSFVQMMKETNLEMRENVPC